MSDESPEPQQPGENSNKQAAAGIGFGIIMGVALGAAFDNLALGIAFGVVFGLVTGGTVKKWKK